MVHPDKCKHPRAQDAFQILTNANNELEDEGKLKELMYVFNIARGKCHELRSLSLFA